MTPDPSALILTHPCEHRLIRVGACPVLEITVTYPALEGDGPEEAVAAFNDGYRRMAEAFLYWGEHALGERVAGELEAEGAGAAFRFDRRLLICTMEGQILEEDGRTILRVRRNLRLTSRRGSVEEHALPTAEDIWRIPELTIGFRRTSRGSDGGERDGRILKKTQKIVKKS